GPGEILIIIEPLDIIVQIQESRIGFREDIAKGKGADIAYPYLIRVLNPVKLLDHHLVGPRYKIHAGEIIVGRIAGYIKPFGGSAGGADHAYFDRRQGGAHFWIGQRYGC